MTNENENTAQRLLRTYREAVFAKDIEAFVAIYDEEIEVFDLWGATWQYQGIDSWRGMAEGWFRGLGDKRVLVEMEDVRIRQMQEAAFVTTFVRYTALSENGESLRSLLNRMTWVLEPKAGVWKVIHEHTSAPADHATLQVSLKR